MPSHTFAVLLQVTTNDPRLTEAKLTAAMESGRAGAFVAIRHAVLSRLPKDVERLVAILPIEHMRAPACFCTRRWAMNSGPIRRSGHRPACCTRSRGTHPGVPAFRSRFRESNDHDKHTQGDQPIPR